MRMKTSLVLKPRRLLARSEAWGCFTANLLLPGSGSLVAGRPIGYAQAALAMAGVGVSCVSTVGLIRWYVSYGDMAAESNTMNAVHQLWLAARWPLLGLVLFVLAMTWALVTSLLILSNNNASPNQALPPNLPPSLPPSLPQ